MASEHDYYSELPGGNYLVISNKALNKMYQLRQVQPHQHEAGGLLIGSMHSNDGGTVNPYHPPHIYIHDVTTPLPLDKSGRTTFLRCDPGHLEKVENCKNSFYLGEWHTHPESTPSPSTIDLNEAQSKLKGKVGLLIIIGIEKNWLAYWDGNKTYPIPPLVKDNDQDL